ncbi:MAG: iron complex transport system substrate-binding protein [Lysobacterales bacterium]|jgi:iron complex transport system substrate-binding protein
MKHPTRPLTGILTGCLVLILFLFSVSTPADIILPQSDGSTLSLDSPASRVITLAPNLAEMMFDAGAGAKLLATVEYSNFPDAAARLPRIGDAFRFDLEQIMALQPDLVIAWSSGNPASALARLEDLGLKVWRTELRNPLDIAGLLESISLATGTGDLGKQAADEVRSRLRALSEKYAGRSPQRYFYQVTERPLFTLNGVHIVSQGLSLCGGVNIFAQEPVLAPQITRESVIQADPDVLLAPRIEGEEDPLGHWRSWPRLKAVRTGALHYLDADKINRATPRLLDSLELACKLLDGHRTNTEKSPENL